MVNVALVIHVLICVALVAVILLQRSEGGGLGIGGGGGGGGLMTGRSAGNLLSTVTMWLAGGFFAVSLFLAIAMSTTGEPRSILDTPAPDVPAVPAAPIAR